jgi:hypothetical protein
VSTDANIVFKNWLPDLPPLDNPGLIEAFNAIPFDGAYKSYRPLTEAGGSSATLPLTPYGAFAARFSSTSELYAAGSSTLTAQLFAYEGGAWTARSATSGGIEQAGADFTQFDDLVLAVFSSSTPMYRTIGSLSAFTALSANIPTVERIAVINRFVVIGRAANSATSGAAYVRWSAIDDPTNWPTPNSATAIATQAGEQWMDHQLGRVTSITDGDQFGLVFQEFGITRFTYVGPPVVFQIDKIENLRGAYFPNSVVRVGNRVFFASDKGFHVTDGVTVQDIGVGKVDRHFLTSVDPLFSGFMRGAVDAARGLIYWAYPDTSAVAGRANRMLIYSYKEDRWSRADQVSYSILDTPFGFNVPYGFMAGNTLASFSGIGGTAIFTTAETEANPGGYTRIKGVKPLVDVTANAVTVAIGTRNNRSDAVTFTSETTANSRSGFCDFRSEARYHRARVTIAGTFNAAQGIEIDASFSGET